MNKCLHLMRFFRTRVARLEANGVPDPGAGNMIITDSQISLAIGYNNRAGDDFEVVTGNGDVCYALLEPDKLKNLTFALSMCDHSPAFSEMLMGGDLITEAGDTIGYALPAVGTVGNPNGVMLEGWSYNFTGSNVDSDYPYVRFVFGKTTWTPADKTLENNPIVNDFTGVGYENSNAHDGPANDFPVSAVAVSDRLYMWFGDTTVPEPSCEPQSVVVS